MSAPKNRSFVEHVLVSARCNIDSVQFNVNLLKKLIGSVAEYEEKFLKDEVRTVQNIIQEIEIREVVTVLESYFGICQTRDDSAELSASDDSTSSSEEPNSTTTLELQHRVRERGVGCRVADFGRSFLSISVPRLSL